MTRVRVALALLALLVAGGGCGGGDGDDESGATAPRSATVPIKDFKYAPATVTIRAGGQVRWVNRDRASHTATVPGGRGFDTDTLRTGAGKALTFPKPGRYVYTCLFHPFMKGTVIVR